MNRKRTVLLFGPYPPIIGGVSSINEIIFRNSRYPMVNVNSMRYRERWRHLSSLNLIILFFQIFLILEFLCKLIRYHCHIVHIAVSSYSSFYQASAIIILSHLFRRKTVIHLHGGDFNQFYDGSHFLLKKYIQYIFNKNEFIITLSSYWKAMVVQKFDISPQKVVILHNCYPMDFNVLEQSVKAKPNMDSKNNVNILFVGSLSQKKGVLDMISMCAQLLDHTDRFMLYIAGFEKEEGIVNKIEELIKHHHVNHHVKLLGEIHGYEKRQWYWKSHVFLFPSYIENFPVTILEAMRAGLPVISTPVGAIPEIIKENENGFLIQSGNVDAFTNKIWMLLKNETLRLKMARTNIEKALNGFNPEQYAYKLADIYDQVK